MDTRPLLHDVADHAADWFDGVARAACRGRRARPPSCELTRELGAGPVPVERVIADLVREALPGLTAINSPRFFGFVMGGAHPAGVAADWLATAWDQNAGLAGADARAPPRSRRSPAAGSPTCSGFPPARRSRSSPAARWRT